MSRLDEETYEAKFVISKAKQEAKEDICRGFFTDQNGCWHLSTHVLIAEEQAMTGVATDGCCVSKAGSCDGFCSKAEAEASARDSEDANKSEK